MLFLSRLLNWRPWRAAERVVFDQHAISHTPLRGAVTRFDWADLDAIDIETTAQGPFVDDVFWLLSGPKGLCRISNAAEGMQALRQALQALPGFDHDVAIMAMAMAVNARFPCWRRAEP
ncbi:hypothetical protein [Chromobacterium sp.]|uniref:hypothetical protein n=1 Tax=Chromobacterium sp. TaxID=306190 RepID=UPI0035AE213C